MEANTKKSEKVIQIASRCCCTLQNLVYYFFPLFLKHAHFLPKLKCFILKIISFIHRKIEYFNNKKKKTIFFFSSESDNKLRNTPPHTHSIRFYKIKTTTLSISFIKIFCHIHEFNSDTKKKNMDFFFLLPFFFFDGKLHKN